MGWQADVLQVAPCLPTARLQLWGCPIEGIGGFVEQEMLKYGRPQKRRRSGRSGGTRYPALAYCWRMAPSSCGCMSDQVNGETSPGMTSLRFALPQTSSVR